MKMFVVPRGQRAVPHEFERVEIPVQIPGVVDALGVGVGIPFGECADAVIGEVILFDKIRNLMDLG